MVTYIAPSCQASARRWWPGSTEHIVGNGQGTAVSTVTVDAVCVRPDAQCSSLQVRRVGRVWRRNISSWSIIQIILLEWGFGMSFICTLTPMLTPLGRWWPCSVSLCPTYMVIIGTAIGHQAMISISDDIMAIISSEKKSYGTSN